jgi:hypothetical protein
VKTIVKLQRQTRETVYEVDLPFIPEGALLRTPESTSTRVVMSAIDIAPANGPVQTLVVM